MKKLKLVLSVFIIALLTVNVQANQADDYQKRIEAKLKEISDAKKRGERPELIKNYEGQLENLCKDYQNLMNSYKQNGYPSNFDGKKSPDGCKHCGDNSVGVPLDCGLLILLFGAGASYFGLRKKKQSKQ